MNPADNPITVYHARQVDKRGFGLAFYDSEDLEVAAETGVVKASRGKGRWALYPAALTQVELNKASP